MCDPNCPCWDDWEEDDDYATKQKNLQSSVNPINLNSQKILHLHQLLYPSTKKNSNRLQSIANLRFHPPIPHSPPTVQPIACMMFSFTSSDYFSSFPPLETHTDSQRNVVSKLFIPSAITSTGHLEPPKPFESVLNWQTQNARAQNDTLFYINSKVEKISLRTEQIESKLTPLLPKCSRSTTIFNPELLNLIKSYEPCLLKDIMAQNLIKKNRKFES